jgi:hypothetical protein
MSGVRINGGFLLRGRLLGTGGNKDGKRDKRS